ncbi:MAG: hypothetical protein ABIR70_06500 [Bryobacteraceae bacterium]
MKKIILILTAAVVGLAQQVPASPPPPAPAALAPGEIVRVVEVKQANSVYQSLKAIFPGISLVNESRVLVRGPVAVVDMIEEAIKKLEAPLADAGLNVELTIQLLQGYAQEGAGGPIPNDLEPTVRQLRALFPYKSYKVIDTQIFRAKSGKYGDISGTLPGSVDIFNFVAAPTVNVGPAPRTVHLGNLRLSFRKARVVDGKTQYDSFGINTDIDAREGQKTVVGKSNIAGSEDAIILVVTPKVE